MSHPTLKILILDLDVHQGNGNASILNEDENVFVISFHGKHNYPYRKVASHLDVEFENETSDEEYLAQLESVLNKCTKMNFDMIFYQAGVDALYADAFGKLALTHNGLRQRDKMVFQFMRHQNIPMAMVLGGGYAKDIQLSVDAYVNTYLEAKTILS